MIEPKTDDVRADMIQAQDPESDLEADDSVCATHAGVAIIAPAGTKRHQLGRVGSRISGHLRDLNLWGTWTFTFQGRQRRTKR